MARKEEEAKWFYCCPFGTWIVIPIVLHAVGLTMFTVAAFSCRTFASVATDDVTGVDDTIKFGYWRYEADGECKNMNDLDGGDDGDDDVEYEVVDETMKTGRAFGVIGVTAGFLVFVFLVTFSCIAYPRAYKPLWLTIAGLSFILAAFCGVLFVGFGHDELCNDDNFDDGGVTISCKPGWAGYLAMIAFVFYAGEGITIIFLALRTFTLKPRHLKKDHQQEQPLPQPAALWRPP